MKSNLRERLFKVVLIKYILLLFFLGHLIVAPVMAENSYNLNVEQYEIVGDNPLSLSDTNAVLLPFLGPLQGLQQLQEATAALQNALQAKGYGFYTVSLAPQTLDKGIVKLNISAIKVDSVSVQQGFVREVYFSKENIRNSIPSLQEGKSPNIYRIAREIELTNKNPAKRVNIQFSRSKKRDRIDANVSLNADEPDSFYTWLNNTGTKYTGDYRLGIGYRHTNLFDKDHELALSFTTSPDFPKDVQQYGLSYRIPLYKLLSVWQFYAYYSDIDSGVVAGGFDVSGSGTFIGSKYEWHLPNLTATKAYSHQLIFGFDDKLFDNEVFFIGNSLGNDVRSTPLSIAYRGLWKELKKAFGFYFEIDKNLEFGNLNNDKIYAINRHMARADWELLRLGSNFEWQIERWMLKGRFNGQYANQALISGEQFGIGGVTGGVRGFIERELSGDKGIRGSLELFFPSVWKRQIRFLVYADAGYVQRVNALPSEFESESIVSTGIGMIWKISNAANLSIYLSQALNGNDTNLVEDPTEKGHNKVQFNLFINF